jgi:hypothetical protein
MVGHAYQLRESDYRFGTGTILVHVTEVMGPTEYDPEPWWRVKGHVAIGTAEHHGGWQYREFLEVRGGQSPLRQEHR